MIATEDLYRQGGCQRIRFTLPGDAFLPLGDVKKDWTPAAAEWLKDYPYWRCHSGPLPMAQVLAVDAKSYDSPLWVPIEATPEFVVRFPDDPMRRGFAIDNKKYCAKRFEGKHHQHYQDIFVVISFPEGNKAAIES